MCNEVARRIALGELRDDFAQLRIPLRFPEGLPNMAPLESVRITDPTVIVRAANDGVAEMVTRRWSWPGQGGRPVYNIRSEGRDLTDRRCLVPITGFYEFTAPADPRAKRKDKWRFTLAHVPDNPLGSGFLAVAGLWRTERQTGEAFALLTCEPGADVAPYHSRQIVLLPRAGWAAWLGGEDARALIGLAPAGALSVDPVARG
jgi:putative SOS response-associated peptidase YedK